MPTIMKRRDPLAKESVDIQARGQKRLRAMEEAGKIHGKTPQQAKQDANVDAVFDVDNNEDVEPDGGQNILERFWDTLTE